MKLFSRSEINTGRQYEFDLAKAICILGMVFVHCFEEFPLTESGYNGSLYYIFVIVLDAIFGAGTFMICLGVGLTYTKKNNPNDFIKRGLMTFLLGYLLNLVRFVLPFSTYFLSGEYIETLKYLVSCFLFTDIMQFAGLAFLLFGLLKKIKIPDWGIALIAIIMSIVGTFVRFVNPGDIYSSEILGLIIGTSYPNFMYPFYSTFPLLNWFIIVIFGYFFGKLIRRVENIEKFYAISTSISAVVVITYMAIAIPNKIGMMNGDTIYYFQMTSLETLIIMMGAVFVFGLYHYILKLFNEKAKNFISRLSVNINKTYCIHWVIIGFLELIFWALFEEEGMQTYIVLIISFLVYIVSTLLAELIKRRDDKKKALKYAEENNN